MRVTSKMMTTNALYNINHNKRNITKYLLQTATGMKIQKPSEDPIIAIRSLKLRTSINQIDQYKDRNVKDAEGWMNATEDALSSVSGVMEDIIAKCTSGANDSMSSEDRKALSAVFQQFKSEIMQRGTTDYAGRTVFTGYKTDKSLTFLSDEPEKSYSMTERFDGTKITLRSVVYPQVPLDPVGTVAEADQPNMFTPYTIQLGYTNLSADAPELPDDLDPVPDPPIDQSIILWEDPPYDDSGNPMYEEIDVTAMLSTDANAYNPTDDQVIFLHDTGELILGKEAYEKLVNAKQFDFSYQKTGFKQEELRPEHYFNCYDMTDPDNAIAYVKSDQQIQYEVSYNQMMTVNVQGSTVFTHDIVKELDYIGHQVDALIAVEGKIDQLKKMIDGIDKSDPANAGTLSDMNSMMEALTREKDLQDETVQKSFERGLTFFQNKQDNVDAVVADLGVRGVRLDLVLTRLTEQRATYKEILTSNEGVPEEEAIVNYNTAELVYNAALQATGSMMQNSLLDFL